MGISLPEHSLLLFKEKLSKSPTRQMHSKAGKLVYFDKNQISNFKITLIVDSLELFHTSTTNKHIDINLFLYFVAIISGE